MNVYRYLVVKYKPQRNDRPTANIGIIIQRNEEVDCKFSSDIARVKSIIGSDQPVDQMIFSNLEKTFKDSFLKESFTITDKNTGNQKIIKYTSEDYLNYLSSNFLNNYVFNNKGLLEAASIEEGLVRLYKNFVDPQFVS